MLNSTDAPEELVRSWKAYTTDWTREAGPVRSIDLDDGVRGGMIAYTAYPCTVFTICEGGCSWSCGN